MVTQEDDYSSGRDLKVGYAEKLNPKSEWNKKKNADVVKQVSTPAKQDEPVIVEINPKNIVELFKDLICRILRLKKSKPQTNHA